VPLLPGLWIDNDSPGAEVLAQSNAAMVVDRQVSPILLVGGHARKIIAAVDAVACLGLPHCPDDSGCGGQGVQVGISVLSELTLRRGKNLSQKKPRPGVSRGWRSDARRRSCLDYGGAEVSLRKRLGRNQLACLPGILVNFPEGPMYVYYLRAVEKFESLCHRV